MRKWVFAVAICLMFISMLANAAEDDWPCQLGMTQDQVLATQHGFTLDTSGVLSTTNAPFLGYACKANVFIKEDRVRGIKLTLYDGKSLSEAIAAFVHCAESMLRTSSTLSIHQNMQKEAIYSADEIKRKAETWSLAAPSGKVSKLYLGTPLFKKERIITYLIKKKDISFVVQIFKQDTTAY